MHEEMGAKIEFGDVLSIADPTVRSVLESDLLNRLSGTHFRQFRLTSRSIVLLFDRASMPAIAEALHKLERDLHASHSGRLDWKTYDLKNEVGQFRVDCRASVESGRNHGHDEISFRPDADRLGSLLHIIESLRNIDLAPHIREQTAVRIDENGNRTNEFVEIWVGLDDLEQVVGVPIRADPWRFARVTEFLDFRVIDHLLHRWHGEHTVSVNLHCGTVMQLRFDEQLMRINPAWRSSMIFELALSEMLDDPVPFMAAVHKLHAAGFRIALDAVIWPSVVQISGSLDKFEMAKVPWTDAFAKVTAEQKASVRKVIDSSPKVNFVLNRCTRPENVEVGRTLGFEIFQGWGVVPVQQAPVHREY